MAVMCKSVAPSQFPGKDRAPLGARTSNPEESRFAKTERKQPLSGHWSDDKWGHSCFHPLDPRQLHMGSQI